VDAVKRCECGKLTYPTRGRAEESMRLMVAKTRHHSRLRKDRRPSAGTLNTYPCELVPGAWHVGNTGGRPK
jgi:hypothetical protein